MAELVNTALETVNTVNPLLNRLLVAIIILLVGFAVGKLLGKFIKKILEEMNIDKNLNSTTGWKFSLEKLIANFITYFTYLIAIIMTLDTLDVTSAVLNMIAGTIILLVLISIVLAIKDFVPNMMAGLMLKNRKEYKKGVKVKIKNIEGKILEIGLLETTIITNKKDTILVPNSIFTKNETFIKN